ncbi:shikimate dehydrogenase [Notoacmeibacter sp. MSK16QG-6]|uniref:shikimate dehydrogenase n=1 Tax=Notoacmeibacter sp. MSK16QG-6 TaxID=2957982 RepID=UPI00209CDB59|nr:shikimate dehydrogenase [Notoacmeibacter sp. MSK16QG-6]MCP1199515.1 shikimate dehydrogenase [Notoacmeibacter sp. MSK16QG-6]
MGLGQVEGRSSVGACELRLGLIGRGIGPSRTPAMHETEAAAQGLSCCYDLLDMDVRPSDVPLVDILDRAEADGFAGLNVTFPYKREVMNHLHQLSEAAQRVGAVNTVVFRDGERFGHNTDFWGFSESLRRGMSDVSPDIVFLIGAGGAGCAIAHALIDLGVERLLIFDTRSGAADDLAKAVGPRAEAVGDVAAAVAMADGLVNATPVGMAKLPHSPIDPALIEARHWVADIVYFPLETILLKEARARGCRTLSGEGMAVFQAVRAFELFTGRAADADRMRDTFRRLGPR